MLSFLLTRKEIFMNKEIIIGMVLIIIGGAIILHGFLHIKKEPQLVEIVYKINAGIPFRWEYKIENEDIIEFLESKVIKNENTHGKVGAPVYTKYIFKGLQKGKTKIIFTLKSITNEYPEKKEIYEIEVDEEKNAKIIETKE